MDFQQHIRHSRATHLGSAPNPQMSLLLEATLNGDKEQFLRVLEQSPGVLQDTVIASAEYPLHIASKLGHTTIVREIVSRKPGFARELNQDGFSPIHLASSMGHIELVQELIFHTGKDLCLLMDKFGMNPLHTAAMAGRLELMKVLVGACPKSLVAVTARRETPLHIAVIHNQCKAVQILVKWLLKTKNLEVVNARDRSGNTILHLATSRKQFQTIKTLLAGDPIIKAAVEVNAVNTGGFTSLDILEVLPPGEDMDLEIDKILRRAGALQARHISCPTPHHCSEEVLTDSRNTRSYPSHDAIRSSKASKQPLRHDYSVILLPAAVATTITFYAALSLLGITMGEGTKCITDENITFLYENHNIIPTGLFILSNTAGFLTSIAMITYIVIDLPVKLWLLISLSLMLGSYTCLIASILPNMALNQLFLASPALLWAAAWIFAIFCSLIVNLSIKYLPPKSIRHIGIH